MYDEQINTVLRQLNKGMRGNGRANCIAFCLYTIVYVKP